MPRKVSKKCVPSAYFFVLGGIGYVAENQWIYTYFFSAKRTFVLHNIRECLRMLKKSSNFATDLKPPNLLRNV